MALNLEVVDNKANRMEEYEVQERIREEEEEKEEKEEGHSRAGAGPEETAKDSESVSRVGEL